MGICSRRRADQLDSARWWWSKRPPPPLHAGHGGQNIGPHGRQSRRHLGAARFQSRLGNIVLDSETFEYTLTDILKGDQQHTMKSMAEDYIDGDPVQVIAVLKILSPKPEDAKQTSRLMRPKPGNAPTAEDQKLQRFAAKAWYDFVQQRCQSFFQVFILLASHSIA